MPTSSRTGYRVATFATPAEAWEAGGREAAAGAPVAYSLEFLEACHRTLGGPAGARYRVVRDPRGEPCALAVTTRKRVDPTANAVAPVAALVRLARVAAPSFLRFEVLILGFPFFGAFAPVWARPGAASPALTKALVEALLAEADATGAAALLVQDLTADEEARALPGLDATDLRRAPSLPDHLFPAEVGSLDGWRARLVDAARDRWGAQLDRFEGSGLRVEHHAGEAGLAAFDDHVHALHETISVDRTADYVDLTAAFFRQVAAAVGARARWTYVFDGDEVVGFVFGLLDQGAYYSMYLGHRPELEARAALYANLVLRDAGAALAAGATEVRLGTEIRLGRPYVDWKADLGCRRRPRSMFMAARGVVLRTLLAIFAPLLFRPPYDPGPRLVLR